MKKVIVLSFCLCVCASVVANSACNDPLGWLVPEDVKCNCAHPIIDFKTMRVSCKPTYCPAGMECMENGHCCDGKVVDNYVDGIGVSGKVCCPVKDDIAFDDGGGQTGYTVVGAANGACCGGYTKLAGYDLSGFLASSGSDSYAVVDNNGFYCQNTHSETDHNAFWTYTISYPSVGKICFNNNGIVECACSDAGDPKNGTTCNP